MTTKKTLSVDEEHAEFLDKTGIPASKVFRAAINQLQEQLTPKEKALLMEYNNPTKPNFNGLEVKLE